MRPAGVDYPDLEVFDSADIFAEEQEWWASVCADVDTVIHVAWYAEPGKYLESPNNLDCLSGTLTLAKACAQAGVRHFVGIGTCFEYDLEGGLLSTDTPLKPGTLYGSAKAATYLSLASYFAGLGRASPGAGSSICMAKERMIGDWPRLHSFPSLPWHACRIIQW